MSEYVTPQTPTCGQKIMIQSSWQIFNGTLTRTEVPPLSSEDGLVSYGLGIMASVLVLEGRLFAMDRHFTRLVAGCRRLGLSCPSREELEYCFKEALKSLEHRLTQKKRLRCRFTLGQRQNPGETVVLLSVGELPHHAPVARTAIWPHPRNEHSPLVGLKCTSYAENLLARSWAMQRELTEAIFLNTAGRLCEGTTSNLFWVNAETGALQTPALESGCLPGVTREILLNVAVELGIPLEEGHFSPATLETASEAFLTSSYRIIQPISQHGHICYAQQNPIQTRLHSAWLELEKSFLA